MDSLNETVIFPDRPLFLTHRKKPGRPGTIDLSPANLNAVLAGSSCRNRSKQSTFQVQSQPTSAAAEKAPLSQYRKIKFIDNNVADITKRRSARPRKVKSKHLTNNIESPHKDVLTGSSDSTSPESENANTVDETFDDFVRSVVHANPAEPLKSSLTLVMLHSPQRLYTDKMSRAVRNFVPHMLSYYLSTITTTVYPLSPCLIFNPMKSHWLPMAMSDELMLRTTLFACTMHMTYLGKGYSRECTEILQTIVREINRRIIDARDSANFSDATVCAISCLALTEVYCNQANRVLVPTNERNYDEQVVPGNWDRWRLHIEGMKCMISLRGGMQTIPEGFRMKIYRADVEGAVESGMLPLFDPPAPTYTPLELSLRPGQLKEPFTFSSKQYILSLCNLDPIVLNVLTDLTKFSLTVDKSIQEGKATIHPGAMDEFIVNLHHRLLKVPLEAYTDINNACRFASLLYIKSLLRSSEMGWVSVRLAGKLRIALGSMISCEYPMPLLCWLCYMGLFGSMPTGDRWTWFANTLIYWYTLRKGRQPDWISLREELLQLPWIPYVHDESGRSQWQMVENVVIFGTENRITDPRLNYGE